MTERNLSFWAAEKRSLFQAVVRTPYFVGHTCCSEAISRGYAPLRTPCRGHQWGYAPLRTPWKWPLTSENYLPARGYAPPHGRGSECTAAQARKPREDTHSEQGRGLEHADH